MTTLDEKLLTTMHPKKMYLINRDFQLRYTKAAIAVGTVSTLITSFIILYPLFVFGILRIPRFLPWPILAAMALAATLNILFVAFMGVIVTHKIAGPMYAIVRFIRRLSSGRFDGRISIRDSDDLKLVVRHINELGETLKKMAENDKKVIDDALASLESAQGKAEDPSLLKMITLLQEQKNALQRRIESTVVDSKA